MAPRPERARILAGAAARSSVPPAATPNTRHLRNLVTEHAAAELLGLSVRTLQKWRLRGGGPAFLKLGHAVRYDLEDVERFVRERRRCSTSDPGP